MKPERVTITDHAVIRYLERALDIRIDDVRAKLAAHVRGPMATGATTYFDGAFTYVFDGYVLVTIYEGRSRSSGPGRANSQS